MFSFYSFIIPLCACLVPNWFFKKILFQLDYKKKPSQFYFEMASLRIKIVRSKDFTSHLELKNLLINFIVQIHPPVSGNHFHAISRL